MTKTLHVGCLIKRFDERGTVTGLRRDGFGRGVVEYRRHIDGCTVEEFAEQVQHAKACPCKVSR